jgi:hypothetical protein
MLRDQGAARALRELYEVEETSPVDSYADEISWDSSVLERLRATIAQHFAGGESSNSAALHAAISNIEDEYLAEEEDDEAASDLSCSLGARNTQVPHPILLLYRVKETIGSFQEIIYSVFRTRRQMMFSTEFSLKFAAVVRNAAFPSNGCTLVAAANAGCF